MSRRLSRVSVITSASGSGGTTFGRTLAERLGVPFHELDALFWKPGWTESTPEELLAAVEPIVASDAWVIDGGYYGKLGDLVYRNADLVVWLDLAPHVWLPRLVRRTFVRAARGELIWGTNRESLRTALSDATRCSGGRSAGTRAGGAAIPRASRRSVTCGCVRRETSSGF